MHSLFLSSYSHPYYFSTSCTLLIYSYFLALLSCHQMSLPIIHTNRHSSKHAIIPEAAGCGMKPTIVNCMMKTAPFWIPDSGVAKTDGKMKGFVNGDGNLMAVTFPGMWYMFVSCHAPWLLIACILHGYMHVMYVLLISFRIVFVGYVWFSV